METVDLSGLEESLSNVNLATPKKKLVAAAPQRSTPKRKVSTPKKPQDVSPLKTRRTNSPAATANPSLDESFRRTVLKINLTQCMEAASPRTPSRRGSKFYYYESTSDTENEENLIVTGKRQSKTPAKYNTPQTPEPRARRKSTRNYYYETCSDGSDIEPPAISAKRTIKSPAKYNDYDTQSPVKPRLGRPRTRSQSMSESGMSVTSDVEEPKTPSRRRTAAAAPATPKSTTANRAKLIRDGVITPSMHARDKVIGGDSTPLMRARSQLHVSHVPQALPCREREYGDIEHFLRGKLLDGCGGCMYISGVPGTGKTATVTSVINRLVADRKVPKFEFVSVNGMRLTEPRQAYVEILKQLGGKTVPWEQAQSLLEDKFTKAAKKNKATGNLPVVMLIDELDILCTKRQDVVYNLLDWPTKARNQLVVITIANTMDLPERLLMSRVTSRLGLTRLTFQAYTHKQLQEIVGRRLAGTDSFNPDAVQLVARKVASVSGDARRALDICRRAAELADADGLVSMAHVNEALGAMITQPKVRAIRRCSRLEQLLLKSIVAEVERTGVEETTFLDAHKMLPTIGGLEGFRMVSGTQALAAVMRLSASRLLLTDAKSGGGGGDIHQRIILNVGVDDVYYALKPHEDEE